MRRRKPDRARPPAWARPLLDSTARMERSVDRLAATVEADRLAAGGDRTQAAQDRTQAAQDRAQAAQDRRRMNELIAILAETNRRLVDVNLEQLDLLRQIARSLRIISDGAPGGNGGAAPAPA